MQISPVKLHITATAIVRCKFAVCILNSPFLRCSGVHAAVVAFCLYLHFGVCAFERRFTFTRQTVSVVSRGFQQPKTGATIPGLRLSTINFQRGYSFSDLLNGKQIVVLCCALCSEIMVSKLNDIIWFERRVKTVMNLRIFETTLAGEGLRR